jgi:hypothetical protein
MGSMRFQMPEENIFLPIYHTMNPEKYSAINSIKV